MPAKKPMTPSIDGWFVPDARMQEIMKAINDKDYSISIEPTLKLKQ